MMDDFKVGDYVVYTDGHKYEIGRIKYVCDGGDAFVAYHEGETGAMTPRDMIHKLENQRVITSLGGEYFKDFDIVRCKECRHALESRYNHAIWCNRDKAFETIAESTCKYAERWDA